MAETHQTLLTIRIDQRSISQVRREVGQVDSALRQLNDSTNQTAKTSGLAGRQIETAYGDKTVRAIERVRNEQAQLAQQIDRTAEAADNLSKGLVNPNSLNELRGFQQEGRFQSFALQNVGGMLPGGGGAFGSAATEAFQLLDTVPKLGLTFRTLKESIVSNVQAIGTSGVGLVGGMLVLNMVMSQVAESARRQREEYAGVIEAQKEYFRLLSDGTTESIEDRRRSVEAELEISQQHLETLRRQQEMLRSDVADHFNAFGLGSLNASILEFASNAGVGDQSFRALSDAISSSENEVVRLRAELRTFDRALESEAVAANDAAAAAEELARQEQELSDQRDRHQQVLDALNQQERSATDSALRQQHEVFEDRVRRDERAAEDWQEAVDKHYQRLESIHLDGQRRIESIRQSHQQAAVDLERRIQETTIKARDDIRQQEIKVGQDYQRDELKRQRDFARQRLRAQQDLDQSIFEAEIANDILSIKMAQRRAAKDERRRQEDFDAEAAERRDRMQERVNEIRREGAARLQEMQVQHARERAQMQQALQERIAAERAAIAERTRAELESQAEQETARQKRLRRQREDDALADRRRVAALQRTLNEIQVKRDAELAALQSIVQYARSVAMATPVMPGSKAAPEQKQVPGKTAPVKLRKFADGGIVPANTPLLAEFEGQRTYPEMVLPLRRDLIEQMMPGVGAQPIVVNLNAPIGDGVSRAEVRASLMDFARMLNDATAAARMGAL